MKRYAVFSFDRSEDQVFMDVVAAKSEAGAIRMVEKVRPYATLDQYSPVTELEHFHGGISRSLLETPRQINAALKGCAE